MAQQVLAVVTERLILATDHPLVIIENGERLNSPDLISQRDPRTHRISLRVSR